MRAPVPWDERDGPGERYTAFQCLLICVFLNLTFPGDRVAGNAGMNAA